MDAWLKIRVPREDYDRWQQLAGHRHLSAWVRGLLNMEVRRHDLHEQGKRRSIEPAIAREEREMRERRAAARNSLPGRVLPSEAAPKSQTCRHGFTNCGVCGTGVFDA